MKALAEKHGMDFDELEKWYDGYQLGQQPSMFNPNSVMTAISEQWCENFWSRSSTTDSVARYISLNYDGLKNAVKETGWKEVATALDQSEQLLKATLRGDALLVARMVGEAHQENTSIIRYSDENSMACVLAIAYYYAHGDYIFHREFQTGKGFADLVLIPRKNVAKPAIIVELKYGDTTSTVIDQIHQRQYPAKVSEYSGDMLLVAISYDKQTKEHQCQIETWSKP